jgi:hypothetical protein
MVAERCKALSLDRADFRFSRREVREHTGWSDFQVKMHMKKLEDLEYVLVHRGRRGQSFVYELLYDGEGQDGGRFVLGLIDPEKLAADRYDENKEHGFLNKEHGKTEKEHSSSPQVAAKEHGSSIASNAVSAFCPNAASDLEPESDQNAYIRTASACASYRTGNGASGAARVAAAPGVSGVSFSARKKD